HRLQTAIGGVGTALGGINALLFSAGVGGNSPHVRAAACAPLGFLGLKLDEKLNRRPSLDAGISPAGSGVRVLVCRAEEDWAIAAECWQLARVSASVRATG